MPARPAAAPASRRREGEDTAPGRTAGVASTRPPPAPYDPATANDDWEAVLLDGSPALKRHRGGAGAASHAGGGDASSARADWPPNAGPRGDRSHRGGGDPAALKAGLGAMQAGLIAVPLPVPAVGSRDDRITAVLTDTEPSVVLTTSAVAPLLWAADQCAAAAGVSRAVWFRWQSSGFCPAAVLRRGRVVRWSAEEIRRWCESSCPPRDRWNVLRGSRT